MSQYKQVCFIGLGYIGLPTAAVVAQNGETVLGVDINRKVIDTINKGDIHIIELGLGDVVRQVVKSGNLRAQEKPEISDVYLIVVPTPFKHNFEPDISYVENATKTVLPFLKIGDLFILESTSPVGTTEKLARIIFSERPELEGKIAIAYCPERVLPGNVLCELIQNDRVIGGIDSESTEKAMNFYSGFVKGELHRTNSKTAEMCKLVENSSRDSQIAFANELSIICDKAGINVWELIRLANKHPRVKILQPGCGVGGHCIAVDPYFIVSDFPREAQMIAKARETNNYKAFWCAEKILKAIIEFENENNRKPKIALMGLAFKPDIDDMRESPALNIIHRVIQKTGYEYFLVEPNVAEHTLYKLTSVDIAIEQADIIVYLVGHKIFKEIKKPLKEKVILDFCGIGINTLQGK